ncbi:MAG: hypothetical protein LJE75_04575 [Gammaproteobacteria bacterium]|jgi:hypothetical protein|nr:hypothetical protein [Gammaproteobacteria bacterium]
MQTVVPCYAIEKPYPGPYFENAQLLMILIPHTPEQMAAFYEARGFPKNAIELITETCFITVHIENKGRQVTWLDTANWRLISNNRALAILGTDYWNRKWEEIDLPQANRSTFYWTQLPAVVDLQPDEPVGGNIVLPGTVRDFHLEANFMTGRDQRGEKIQVNFERVACPRQADSQ